MDGGVGISGVNNRIFGTQYQDRQKVLFFVVSQNLEYAT